MPMRITDKSHTDHSIPQSVLDHLVARFANEEADFKETIELPEGVLLPCGLYGPGMGDGAISRDDVFLICRDNRDGLTPLIKRPMRQSNKLFLVAGPLDDDPCVLYTCYAGPEAPREPWDKSIKDDPGEKLVSKTFWSTHALAVPDGQAIVRIQDKNYEEVVKRLSKAKTSCQQIDKPTDNHPSTGNPMQWLHIECTGHEFHELVKDIADMHYEKQ